MYKPGLGSSHTFFIVLSVTLLAASPLFFIGGPDWASPSLYRVLWSFGHVVFFFVLFILVQMRWPLERARHWLAVSLGVLVVSVVIEAIQSQVGRQASWHDVLRNLTGTWLALFWIQRPDVWVWCGRVLAALLLCYQLVPVVQVIVLHHQASRQFPVLADFEHSRDLRRWQGDIARSTAHSSQGQHSLQVMLNIGQLYPGASFAPMSADWRAYQWLTFSLYNPPGEFPQPLSLVLRINDRAHARIENRERPAYQDRFNTLLTAEPGWNHYRINLTDVATAPGGRAMDMHQIHRVLLFASGLRESRVIYLDDFRLE